MKNFACVLHAVNDLRYEETQITEPLEDEVLIKVKACGICGSDVDRVFKKGTYHFPTVPGHEFSGEIIKAGSAKNEHLIGKGVAVFPLLPCFECEACSIGEYAQCKSYDYYGSRRDGAFAEYLTVKVWNLVFMPENVSYEQAAMCEPTAVAIHGIDRTDLKLGDTILIVGCGTIGLLLALIAKARGAGKVILTDIDKQKLDFAKKLGFKYVLNSADEDLKSQVMDITNSKGADICVEACGYSSGFETAVLSAKMFGVIVSLGNPAQDIVIKQSVYSDILRKQLTIKGTWNSTYNLSKNDWKVALDIISKEIISIDKLITHRFTLDEFEPAFDAMKDKKDLAVKVMFVEKEAKGEI